MEGDLKKKLKNGRRSNKRKKKKKKTTPPKNDLKKMEDDPINQNYLIGCDTIENSPSFDQYHLLSTQNHTEQESL